MKRALFPARRIAGRISPVCILNSQPDNMPSGQYLIRLSLNNDFAVANFRLLPKGLARALRSPAGVPRPAFSFRLA